MAPGRGDHALELVGCVAVAVGEDDVPPDIQLGATPIGQFDARVLTDTDHPRQHQLAGNGTLAAFCKQDAHRLDGNPACAESLLRLPNIAWREEHTPRSSGCRQQGLNPLFAICKTVTRRV